MSLEYRFLEGQAIFAELNSEGREKERGVGQKLTFGRIDMVNRLKPVRKRAKEKSRAVP